MPRFLRDISRTLDPIDRSTPEQRAQRTEPGIRPGRAEVEAMLPHTEEEYEVFKLKQKIADMNFRLKWAKSSYKYLAKLTMSLMKR